MWQGIFLTTPPLNFYVLCILQASKNIPGGNFMNLKNKIALSLIIVLTLGLAGCQSAYYKTMESFGYHISGTSLFQT